MSRDFFERIPLSDILAMYSVYHEMDISSFIKVMETRYTEAVAETKLKRIRDSRGLSQNELAELSGVNVRTIRAYEQKDNEIDKAQAQILYKLSRVLGYEIEDLLENPLA